MLGQWGEPHRHTTCLAMPRTLVDMACKVTQQRVEWCKQGLAGLKMDTLCLKVLNPYMGQSCLLTLIPQVRSCISLVTVGGAAPGNQENMEAWLLLLAAMEAGCEHGMNACDINRSCLTNHASAIVRTSELCIVINNVISNKIGGLKAGNKQWEAANRDCGVP